MMPSETAPVLGGQAGRLGTTFQGGRLTLTDTPDVATRRVAIPSSINMVAVLGPRDEFLHILEEQLDADIHVRGNEITLTGGADAVVAAADVLT